MEQRPGAAHYAVATKAVVHGAPATEDGFVGVAVKQQPPPAGYAMPAVAPGASNANQVQVGEAFVIRLKGLVYVDNSIAAVVGSPVYIVAATNALTLTVGTNLKFGRVEAIAGSRGVGTGKMRVNMDSKDSF